MYLKRCGPSQSKKEHVYWELVESIRTERGPRQRVVTYLGDINQAEGVGVKQAAEEKQGYWQSRLFDAEGEPDWVEVDTKRVQVGRVRDFGGYWLGLQMLDKLELPSFSGADPTTRSGRHRMVHYESGADTLASV